MENKIEFIILSHPSEGSSSSLQRRAYSHAARVNHARVKRARESSSQTGNVEPNVPRKKKGKVDELTEAKEICSVEAKPRERLMLFPDPVDQLTSNRRDPFGGFVRTLSPLEQYLFDHYVGVVTTQYGSECVILRDSSFHHCQLRIGWIQMAISYVGLLNSALQVASRHLYEVYQREEYAALATQYRILSINAVRETIGAQDYPARDPVIATMISMALDELRAGNITTTRQHVRGLAKMIQYFGGEQALGMNGLLKHIFEKLAYDMKLLLDDETSPSGLLDFVTQGGINLICRTH